MRLKTRGSSPGRKIANIVVFLVVTVFLGSLTKNLVYLMGQGGRIEETRAEVAKLEEENERLSRLVEQVGSEEYDEKEIRGKLGLVKPGEAVVMIPEELKRADIGNLEDELEVERPVWEKWVRLFL